MKRTRGRRTNSGCLLVFPFLSSARCLSNSRIIRTVFKWGKITDDQYLGGRRIGVLIERTTTDGRDRPKGIPKRRTREKI